MIKRHTACCKLRENIISQRRSRARLQSRIDANQYKRVCVYVCVYVAFVSRARATPVNIEKALSSFYGDDASRLASTFVVFELGARGEYIKKKERRRRKSRVGRDFCRRGEGEKETSFFVRAGILYMKSLPKDVARSRVYICIYLISLISLVLFR